MAHWLVKSEPTSWSWDQMIAAGPAGTSWNGVRNHQAKKHLMSMKNGEQVFFYHSGEGKEIVGVVEVTKTYYPDPTDKSGQFGMVDVRGVKPLKQPVTLEAVKRDPALANMVLVKNSRLSVQPVTAAEWTHICRLGGI